MVSSVLHVLVILYGTDTMVVFFFLTLICYKCTLM